MSEAMWLVSRGFDDSYVSNENDELTPVAVFPTVKAAKAFCEKEHDLFQQDAIKQWSEQKPWETIAEYHKDDGPETGYIEWEDEWRVDYETDNESMIFGSSTNKLLCDGSEMTYQITRVAVNLEATAPVWEET